VQEIRFAKTSRRHRIGKARARHVMVNNQADVHRDEVTGDTIHAWLGEDDRGLLLEVVAVEKPDCLLVIHVMPADLRER
jgi:hypothetical protein